MKNKKKKVSAVRQGLTVETFATAKKLNPKFLRQVGFSDTSFGGHEAVKISYKDVEKNECAVRYRLSMKGDDRFRWETGAKPMLYGLWRQKKLAAYDYVILAEGESDCVTLWSQGFPALGMPGANTWREEWAQYFTQFSKIFAIIEPDRGGDTVLRKLSKSSIRERTFIIRLKGAKDASELYMQDPLQFKKTFQSMLDSAQSLPGPEDSNPRAGGSEATRLIKLVNDADLFHFDDKAYATVRMDQHRENLPIESSRFKKWLGRAFYKTHGKAPSTKAFSEATNVLAGKAVFEGPDIPVFTRIAGQDGKIYVDLADPRWRAIEISADGWLVVDNPIVRFRRPAGMLPLPEPVPGGSLDDLQSFVHFDSTDDQLLAISWLVTALKPQGPYPILAIHGEQGSGKSTAARLFRALTDPSKASVRTAPRDVRDLMISATNSHVISLDNLSHVDQWLSDALCRLATGGGLATRQLYTDGEEVIFNAMRPALINGIGEVTARGDLMERTVLLYLPAIDSDKRESEQDFWARFELHHPRILGALFSALSTALRGYGDVELTELPRMADYAKWVTAAEPALGVKPGSFLKAYSKNQASANGIVLDSSQVAVLIRRLVTENDDGWHGSATELLEQLNAMRGNNHTRGGYWPNSANALSSALTRLAPNLRNAGIQLDRARKPGTGERLIRLTTVD